MYNFTKRVIDIIVSLTVLVLFIPIFILIIPVLRFSGDGDIFYLQERIGYKNRKFYIWKFATMVKNSLHIGLGGVTIKNDPRVTTIGRILRKTKINEIPQVINILKGDMTLIGPRPLIQAGFENYSKEMQQKIYNVKPGLTGIGSIIFRDEETLVSNSTDFNLLYKNINSYKGKLELWYQKNQTFRTDLLIIFLTAYSIVAPNQTLTYKVFKDLPVLDSNAEINLMVKKVEKRRSYHNKMELGV